jgi:hypothetical protein
MRQSSNASSRVNHHDVVSQLSRGRLERNRLLGEAGIRAATAGIKGIHQHVDPTTGQESFAPTVRDEK